MTGYLSGSEKKKTAQNITLNYLNYISAGAGIQDLLPPEHWFTVTFPLSFISCLFWNYSLHVQEVLFSSGQKPLGKQFWQSLEFWRNSVIADNKTDAVGTSAWRQVPLASMVNMPWIPLLVFKDGREHGKAEKLNSEK